MTGVYINAIGSSIRRKWGDFRGGNLGYDVVLQWTVDGLAVLRGTRSCWVVPLEPDPDHSPLECRAGNPLRWENLPNHWKIVPALDNLDCILFQGETIPVGSLEQWMGFLPNLIPEKALEGTDKLIECSAKQETLSWGSLLTVYDRLESDVLEGRLPYGVALRWLQHWKDHYRQEALRALMEPNPDPRAVHWLQAHSL